MRPSKYNEELADQICERLAEGESLRRICNDEGMPHRITVIRWMDTVEGFATKCARAREVGADVLLDEMQDIEGLVLNEELEPRAAGVVLSSKQWRASKLAPKKYGAKTGIELSGADGGPVQLSSTEREAKLSALLALAQARKDEGSDIV